MTHVQPVGLTSQQSSVASEQLLGISSPFLQSLFTLRLVLSPLEQQPTKDEQEETQ
jgi:hypothetical protein